MAVKKSKAKVVKSTKPKSRKQQAIFGSPHTDLAMSLAAIFAGLSVVFLVLTVVQYY